MQSVGQVARHRLEKRGAASVRPSERKDELVRGRGYATPKGPTDNVAAVGVGGGRDVHPSGSQHGLVTRQLPEGKDILSEFGPEATPRTNR
jgi:hypothetical protein